MEVIRNSLEFSRENQKLKAKILMFPGLHVLVWKYLVLALTLGLTLGGTVQAANFTVTKTADTADGNCDR